MGYKCIIASFYFYFLITKVFWPSSKFTNFYHHRSFTRWILFKRRWKSNKANVWEFGFRHQQMQYLNAISDALVKQFYLTNTYLIGEYSKFFSISIVNTSIYTIFPHRDVDDSIFYWEKMITIGVYKLLNSFTSSLSLLCTTYVHIMYYTVHSV